jgi:hypothetical protein
MKKLLRFWLLSLLLIVFACNNDDEDKVSGTITVGTTVYTIKEGYYSVMTEEEGNITFFVNAIYFASKGITVVKKNNVVEKVKGKGAISTLLFEGNDSKNLSLGNTLESFSVTQVGNFDEPEGWDDYYGGVISSVNKSGSNYTVKYSYVDENDVPVTVEFTGKLRYVDPGD